MVKAFIFICLFTFSATASASKWMPNLTDEQKSLLAEAYVLGESRDIPELMQMILMQETLAGKLGREGDDGDSLGVMQVQVATARFITNRVDSLPKLTDEEIAYNLRYVDGYSMKVGMHYFLYCLDRMGSWPAALVAYNAGPNAAKRMSENEIENHSYIRGIKEKIHIIHLFNERYLRDFYFSRG